MRIYCAEALGQIARRHAKFVDAISGQMFFWAAAGTRAGWMRERFRMPDIRFRPLRRERLVWRDPAGTR